MSYPARPAQRFPGFFLGDFLSPAGAADFASDPAIFAELEEAVGPYQPWSTAIHDGGNEAAVLADLHRFLDQHLKAIQFLMNRCDWDLFIFDLMATDRLQHELWHVWDLTHRAAQGREHELEALRPKLIEFWQRLDRGIGAIEAEPAAGRRVLDHQRPRLRADRALRQFQRLAAGAGLHRAARLVLRQAEALVLPPGGHARMDLRRDEPAGLGNHRVSRFRGKQDSLMDRLGESIFLSRRHIDWSRTRAYAQGNFGQIFLNLKGRQPNGASPPRTPGRCSMS